MRPMEGRSTGTGARIEVNSVVVDAEASTIAQRMRRAVRPSVAAAPGVHHDPHEAARSQAHRARVEKAAVGSDRLAVAAGGGEEVRDCSPLERAAVLLRALGTGGGATEVHVSGTPDAVHAEVRLRSELTEGEHERLLEVLLLADQFGHSITQRDGERVWASYESTTHVGSQPRRGGAPPPGTSFRPGPIAETAAFYAAPARSCDAEYHPPV